MTTQDFIIPHPYRYLLIKFGVVLLALLLWFIITAAPVV
jgi:hypothetical protein